ncbi:MAG: hypothetical protein ACREOB_03005, partial [Thermodesulfobacteriota bacterium]
FYNLHGLNIFESSVQFMHSKYGAGISYMNNGLRLELILFVCLIFLSLAAVSCDTGFSVGDDARPSTVEDLDFGLSSRQLTWVAPGDDGNSGRATVNDIRFFRDTEVAELLGLASVADLDDVEPSEIQEVVQDNFTDATQVLNEPQPDQAGTPQSFLVPRLDITETSTFYFALNVRDEVGNNSGPSNVLKVQTPLVAAEFRDSANAGCFGQAVSSGDFNDDDIDDLVIGDPCLGMVYIFFGRNDFTIGSSDGDGVFDIGSGDTPDVTIIGNAGEMFGASLAGIGNIEGDASDDLVIGAPAFDGDRGRVFVIAGDEDIPSILDFTNGDEPDFVITGENVGDSFGLTVIRRRNNAIFVGAPGAGSSEGRAYLFEGGDLKSVTPADEATTIIIGESAGDMFGFAIAEAGRIEDDSSNDLAIASPGAGKVYVFLDEDDGTKDLSVDTSDVVTIEGNLADGFGSSIAGAGNVIGIVQVDEDVDERDDLLIGAPNFNGNTGSVFLYSGDDIASAEATGNSPSIQTEFTGLNTGDRFGTSIAIPGDLNPDIDVDEQSEGNILELDLTNEDFVIGAPGTAGGTGTVYLFLGRNDFPASVGADEADIVLDGSAPADEFGRLLVNLGNLTDDSSTNLIFKSDFAIGGLGFIRVEF